MNLLIKDARLIDDKQDLVADLYIEKGKIRKIGKALSYNCKTIDGKDLCLLPAFVDIHAHFRDPGYTYKEDIETGSLSALRGGYTFVNLMGNTDPVCSSMEIVDDVLKRAKNLDLVDIHQSVSITKNFDGESLEHLDLLDERVKVITDDGMGIKSNIVMYKAFKKAKEKGLLILSHAEDEDLTPIDYRVSENLISFRDIYLSQVLETRLHLTHVSTKEVIEAIRRAKGKGNKYLTCDVTPHHISLWDSNEKVNPPIRKKADVEAIIEGILDGTVDAIGTDHAPHSEEDKKEGSPGFVGLETAFPVTYTTLVRENNMDIKRLVEIMSTRPAEILDLKKGKFKEGYDGDVVLLDLDERFQIASSQFASKSRNTPFEGKSFYGKVKLTVKGGQIKYFSKSFKGVD